MMGAISACRGERGRYARAPRHSLALATVACLAMACSSALDRWEVDPVAWGYPEHQYVIDRVMFPRNYADVEAQAFDLDYDGQAENSFGTVLRVLMGLGMLDCGLQGSADEAMQRGVVVALFSVYAGAMRDSASANLWSFVVEPSANPPPIGGDPSVDAGEGVTTAYLGGHLANRTGRFGGPGSSLVMDLPACGSLIRLPLAAARVHFEASQNGATLEQGRLGGAIDESVVSDILIPALAGLLARGVEASCSMSTGHCSCTSGSAGESALSGFDINRDCTIDIDEVRTSAFVRPYLTPDVTLPEGTAGLSFAIGFHATATTFTHPSPP